MNYNVSCGCSIWISEYDGKATISYCPKHKAAPDLYEALKATTGRVTHTRKCNVFRFSGMTNLAIKTMIDAGYNNHCDCGMNKVIEQRDEALAKAEGE